MTLETLIASVGVLGALQAAYLVLKSMEAKPVNASTTTWDSTDDFCFETTEDKSARQMKSDFDLERAKSIMAMANEFAESKLKL